MRPPVNLAADRAGYFSERSRRSARRDFPNRVPPASHAAPLDSDRCDGEQRNPLGLFLEPETAGLGVRVQQFSRATPFRLWAFAKLRSAFAGSSERVGFNRGQAPDAKYFVVVPGRADGEGPHTCQTASPQKVARDPT